MSPGKRRRVTFADEPSVVTFESTTDRPESPTREHDDGVPKRRRSPSVLYEPGTSATEDVESDELSVRAQRQNELQNMQGIEDTSILEDLAEAEEEYDKPDQAFNEAGIAFEPFHLKQEREEGYFDADGNYIQYKLDEVKDAWLDSLAEGPSTDTSIAPSASGSASKQSTVPAQLIELDADELLTYKRRLLDMLQPHDTVLTALRRLGGRQEAVQGGGAALPWKRSRKSAGNSSSSAAQAAAGDAGSYSAAALSPLTRTGRTVPVENREAFDRLTEYSSLLLQHGDYNIHSTPREQIAAETDAAEAAQLQAVMGVLSTACPSTASQNQIQIHDMGSVSSVSDADGVALGRVDAAGERATASTAGLASADGMELDAPFIAKLADSGITEAAALAAAAEQSGPADPDEDIFGAAKDATPHEPAMDTAHANGVDSALANGDHNQQAEPSSAGPFTDNVNVSSSHDVGGGFLYDESSGTWYNANLGYYYDASRGLYGDASSGQWYSYKDGAYQLVC